MRALKALGLRIAIDDFGAGHSSLFYLKSFPIDKLKLDRDFVKDIPNDPVSMEIAVAVIRLANSLKVTALAEGVETAAQAEFLAASGCALAQGYLFDKPLWENDLIGQVWTVSSPKTNSGLIDRGFPKSHSFAEYKALKSSVLIQRNRSESARRPAELPNSERNRMLRRRYRNVR